MGNLLEQFTADLSQHFFLREYSFDKNRFHAIGGHQLELADHVIALPDALFLFQLKERDSRAAIDEGSLEKWFEQKVLKKGCGQIADSVRFLKDQPVLMVTNQRGHVRNLAAARQSVIPILLYSACANPPVSISAKKHHVSRRAGFVHLLSITDYYHLCRILALPSALVAYFAFRQDLLLRFPNGHWDETEIAAQFIADTHVRIPAPDVKTILQEAVGDVSTFDISSILRRLGEKVTYLTGKGNDLDYYQILSEFSRLTRAEMRGFKRLLVWALDKAGTAGVQIPARLKGANGTGFLVIPIHQGAFDTRLDALNNLSIAAKYDWRLDRQIGLSVARDGSEVELDWCYLDGPWQQDVEIESALTKAYPFRQTPEPRIEYRYPSSS
ncbi:MAG: hypothetical protein NTV70_21440 [Acidobacteria bacterium]|nr:hypothetical protein [Acidobacteriota bacterium]